MGGTADAGGIGALPDAADAPAGWRRLMAALAFEGQRGHLFPWAPVCLGTGVAVYFSLGVEPDRAYWLAVAAAMATVCAALWRLGTRAPLLVALGLALAGFALAGLRTHLVAAPVLEFRYHGPIQGRIVAIDRSASDKVRLTLDRVILERMDPDRTPARVRVSLHGDESYFDPVPGLTVMLTGHLGPPEGPVEPGGYDFQRQAWFARLGGVGYTRTPALVWAPAEEGRAGLLVHRMRAAISTHMQAVLPGRTGAFAAAITTGDRSGMDEPTLEALRVSNLSHLLAISGLHMGMLTGFVYGLVRAGLALWPRAGLVWPTHRIAAVAALGAGAFYLALSGGNVATERAFIMAAAMLTAVLFDRRALSMRAVALAALVIIAVRPDTLAGPGFQMSFSATIALIAVFAAIRDSGMRRLPKPAQWLFALVVSSAIAGFATGPFAAAHFNRIPHYGLVANLVSVPVMGAVVMPAAVVAAVLAPFGLSWVGLRLMQPGIDWILWVADRVAGWEGAFSMVAAPPQAVLPLVAGGGLLLALWRGRGRLAGIAPILLAGVLWAGAERPVMLVSQDGGLVGLLTPEGRAMSKPRGAGFSADSWLENDGDPADQPGAAERAGFVGGKTDRKFVVAGLRGHLVSGRGAAERAVAGCATAEIVILAGKLEGPPPGPCLLIDRRHLARTGPLALYDDREAGAIRLVATRATTGVRPWNDRALRRRM